MGVIKKKPYEISIWEDRLVTVPVQNVDGAGATDETTSYYKEIKLAVIGSDTMESPNRAFDPVLIENVNGEKTLTFSLAYRYYDEYEGEIITNPFYPYLINERKVKLFYNNEWFEFLIKECEETSKENIFKYTAKELFSIELAKLGYDVVLDTSLNNNQGTIIELAEKVLKNTDWQVDKENSDLLTQYVQDPLYEATTTQELEVLDLDTNQTVLIDSGETIYIFYSYINNKTTDYVQFIRQKDSKKFVIDDDNVIKSTNYRILTPVEYVIDDTTQEVTALKDIAVINGSYYNNQGYRLVYKIKTTYDPIMNRTVDIYQAPYGDGTQEIYHFLDYNYTTSDMVVSYIANGSDFTKYEDGRPGGWYNTTTTSSTDEGAPVLQPLEVTTVPALDSKNHLTLIEELSQLRGFLKLKFNGVLDSDFKNTYFNQGFEQNRVTINHISKGEEFVLRSRYYVQGADVNTLIAQNPTKKNQGLRIIVAKYETEKQVCYINEEAKKKEEQDHQKQTATVKAYKIIPSEILLDFNEEFILSQNIIDSGTFSNDYKQYIVDRVVQTPSTAYIYKTIEDDTEYVWDAKNQVYVTKESVGSDFADYFLTTAQARYSLTNEQMRDPKYKLGIFLYIDDSELANQYIYLQDIQLTRCLRDGNGQIITLGNVPTATSELIDNYYIKPTNQKSKEEINIYSSLDFLAEEFGLNKDTIVPVFNENSEKVSSIQVSHSNYFNILQELCETFECWLDIKVKHEEDGSIALDKNGNPIKKIAFKEYAGKDNFAGFKNGINLEGITRQIDSNEIVTKLIVEPVQSEYSDTGSVAIQQAKSNPSGQSYIINLSYYLNRGLITDAEQCNKDVDEYNRKTKEINQEISGLQLEYANALKSLDKLGAQRTTYTIMLADAEKEYNEAIVRFQELTNWEYNTFAQKYQNIEEWARDEKNKDKNYLENETVMNTVATIYNASVTLNNYSGLLTNLDKCYQDLFLQCYGAKEFNITTTYTPGNGADINPSTQVTVDNYISGLRFQLTDTTDSTVIYQTSPNDRIFKIFNENPYKTIRFLQLPVGYSLKYFINDNSIILSEAEAQVDINIYDNVSNAVFNRRFVLVPNEEFKEQHKGFQQRINELVEEKNEVEKEFYKKYSRFLEEGTWSSQDYIDSELYYFDALQVSNTSAQPKVSYTIDVLEISQIDGFESYDFRVGDKTYIEDTDFFGYLYQAVDISAQTIDVEEGTARAPLMVGNSDTVIARSPVREEVIVSEIEWHFDEPDNNTITIQNYKTRFEDLFQRISATVQAVERNEITYPKTTSILDESGLINSSLLANSLDGIGSSGFALTSNGSVQATQDGLLFRDLLSPSNMMRLSGIGLQVTADGGESWGTAIGAEGITADLLTAGTINTQRIWLMDGDNPSFRWDKSGLNAYGLDENGNNAYDLKTYVRFDKYGLYGIKNDEEYVASSLDDVRSKAFFGVTWDGFFIKNSYTNDGEVSITSDDDIVVRKDNVKRIHIGAVEKDSSGTPTEYGIKIRNDNNEVVFETGDDGNLAVSGTINALAGNFTGQVNVGNPDSTHIIIDGGIPNPVIQSSNYSDGAGTGWIIDSNGDATFSNVSVRGAIKTAVFEYEEIQAVGGAFLFRPSSTIKTVEYEVYSGEGEGIETTDTFYHYENGNKVYEDLIVTVEKPLMFREKEWVKISNYNSMGTDPAADLTTYGLVHIYQIGQIISTEDEGSDEGSGPDEPVSTFAENTGETSIVNENGESDEEDDTSYEPVSSYKIVLTGGCAILESVSLENVPGGALISFGRDTTTYQEFTPASEANPSELGLYELINNEYVLTEDTTVIEDKVYYKNFYENGRHNYGIGVNSSDNYVNLPARAISLFETTIHPNDTTKVTYNYRGILGTLPQLPYEGNEAQVSPLYDRYLKGTQGVYTDNLYIGDHDQYMAFYTDESGRTQLRIVAKKFEVLPDDGDLIDLGNSIVDQKIQYSISISTEYNSLEEEWATTPYEIGEDEYLWQRTYIKYASGRIEYLPSAEGYYVSNEAGQPGPQGPQGEDAVLLHIDSSNGNTFKNNSVNTELTVTIFKGATIINNLIDLQSAFGNTAYLQWYWKRRGDSTFKELLSTDSMLSNDGFTLTLTPDKVDVKVVFQCEIKTVDE